MMDQLMMDLHYAPFTFVGTLLNVFLSLVKQITHVVKDFLPGLGQESALGLESKLTSG